MSKRNELAELHVTVIPKIEPGEEFDRMAEFFGYKKSDTCFIEKQDKILFPGVAESFTLSCGHYAICIGEPLFCPECGAEIRRL